MLIKNRKGERGERGVWVCVWVFGGWGVLSQAVGRTGRGSMGV